MCKVWMTNFGTMVYMGTDIDAARVAAINTGFECTMSIDDDIVMSWSPISGWRSLSH